VDEHRLARGIGWLSIGVGFLLVLAPERGTGGFGMGERKRLGLFLGAKDLVIGAGLLRSGNVRPWLLARALSDAQDAALLVGGIASGAFPRRKASLGLAVATGLCASSLALARRLG
jgi:hypothetical protein